MIKKLLVLFAAATVISLVCFTLLGLLGGLPPAFGPDGWDGPPWANAGGRRDPGPEVTRNLPFTGSDRLDLSYPAEVVVTQGSQPRFSVTGPQSVLDQLHLEGGSLIWNGRRQHRWGRRFQGRLRIDIIAPAMHEFHLAGAQQLTLRNFDQDRLILHASGAADIEGQGKARQLEAHISGAGDLKLDQLPVSDAEVTIAGAGDASVDARNSADVSISGAGHVRFKCRPERVMSHISGFGSVDEGPNCGSEPPPAASTPGPPQPAPPAPSGPKSKV